MAENQLPQEFTALEPFVEGWALATERGRNAKRLSSTMDEITDFYAAIFPLMPAILKHLDTFELGKLPERELRLLYLTFSLIEGYTAVEWYKQPQVVDGYASERLVPVQEMQLDGTTWRGR